MKRGTINNACTLVPCACCEKLRSHTLTHASQSKPFPLESMMLGVGFGYFLRSVLRVFMCTLRRYQDRC
eukprot:m.265868 g.265868  ORF g.265868 m.265868 type:complete len:69 (+) comp15627_c0_seq37:3661-3867(+)